MTSATIEVVCRSSSEDEARLIEGGNFNSHGVSRDGTFGGKIQQPSRHCPMTGTCLDRNDSARRDQESASAASNKKRQESGNVERRSFQVVIRKPPAVLTIRP